MNDSNGAREELIAHMNALRSKLARALKISEADLRSRAARSQPLAHKLCVAAYALNKTQMLPPSGIADLLGKTVPWVYWAVDSIERREKNQLFRAWVDEVVAALIV